MSKGQSLQDPFLNALRRERVPVAIYLVNGIKLQGTIESFDQFVVLLRNQVSQMVYKHAISTVVPSRNVRMGNGHDGHDGHEADTDRPRARTESSPSRIAQAAGGLPGLPAEHRRRVTLGIAASTPTCASSVPRVRERRPAPAPCRQAGGHRHTITSRCRPCAGIALLCHRPSQPSVR